MRERLHFHCFCIIAGAHMEPPNEIQRSIFGPEVTRELLNSLDQPLLDREVTSDYSSEIDSSFENDIHFSDAQQQWEENIRQLETAVFYVLCPVLGRIVGRKAAHSIWIRFVTWRWNSAQTSGFLKQFQ